MANGYMYSLRLLGCSRSAISARCGPLQSWGIAVRHVKMEHCAPADYRSAHRPGDTLPATMRREHRAESQDLHERRACGRQGVNGVMERSLPEVLSARQYTRESV